MMYGLYAEGRLIIHGVLVNIRGYMMYGLYAEGKLIIHGVLVYDVLVRLIIHGVLIYDVAWVN